MKKSDVVYPGHPAVIALFILRKYNSRQAATLRTPGSAYGAALADNDIPGAGGNVHMALDLLKWVSQGLMTPEQAMAKADDMWAHCDSMKGCEDPVGKYARGLDQAASVREEILAKLRGWK